MTKYKESARGQQCQIRLVGICNRRNDTTVLAHFRAVYLRCGVGIKPVDIFGAYACSACHDAVDGRAKTHYTKDELRIAHLEGVMRTQQLMIDGGILDV
jgi:hypothetical protein